MIKSEKIQLLLQILKKLKMFYFASVNSGKYRGIFRYLINCHLILYQTLSYFNDRARTCVQRDIVLDSFRTFLKLVLYIFFKFICLEEI